MAVPYPWTEHKEKWYEDRAIMNTYSLSKLLAVMISDDHPASHNLAQVYSEKQLKDIKILKILLHLRKHFSTKVFLYLVEM